jgi:hypothetical protein
MSKLDAPVVFVTAEQFRFASKWLIRAPDMGCEPNVEIPSVTCAALALELYLKCLIAIEGTNNPEIHDLQDLFAKLSRGMQSRVKAHFDRFSAGAKEYVQRDAAKTGSPAPTVDFDYVLAWSRKGFTKSRYIFENGLPPETGWIADSITECARRTILDMYPEWFNFRLSGIQLARGLPPTFQE